MPAVIVDDQTGTQHTQEQGSDNQEGEWDELVADTLEGACGMLIAQTQHVLAVCLVYH